MSTYNEILDLVNNIDNIDELMLESLSREQEIKIIDEDGETSYSYNDFLNMFDEQGLTAFC